MNKDFKWNADLAIKWAEHVANKTQSGNLNPIPDELEDWINKQQQDWIITELKYQGKILTLSLGQFRNSVQILPYSPLHKIHAVKRLSDDVTFRIGDEIYVNYPRKLYSIKSFKISTIDPTKIMAELTTAPGYVYSFFLDRINKLNPILFTTHDGVNLTTGSAPVFSIRKGTLEAHTGASLASWLDGWYTMEWLRYPRNNDPEVLRLINEHYLLFSTKEARDQYIFMNKPLFSAQDILNMDQATEVYIKNDEIPENTLITVIINDKLIQEAKNRNNGQ